MKAKLKLVPIEEIRNGYQYVVYQNEVHLLSVLGRHVIVLDKEAREVLSYDQEYNPQPLGELFKTIIAEPDSTLNGYLSPKLAEEMQRLLVSLPVHKDDWPRILADQLLDQTVEVYGQEDADKRRTLRVAFDLPTPVQSGSEFDYKQYLLSQAGGEPGELEVPLVAAETACTFLRQEIERLKRKLNEKEEQIQKAFDITMQSTEDPGQIIYDIQCALTIK